MIVRIDPIEKLKIKDLSDWTVFIVDDDEDDEDKKKKGKKRKDEDDEDFDDVDEQYVKIGKVIIPINTFDVLKGKGRMQVFLHTICADVQHINIETKVKVIGKLTILDDNDISERA